MANDILQEVSQHEITRVLESLKTDWPKHFLLHQFISITQEYKTNNNHFPKQFIYRYGTIEDAVYLVQSTFSDGPDPISHLFVYTVSTDLSNLSKALLETSKIPWLSKNVLFDVIYTQFTPSILEATTARGFNWRLVDSFMYWFPPEDKIDTGKLPDDVYLAFLDKSHIPEIDENWPRRWPGSDHFLVVQLQNNFGLGLFRKSDKRLLSSAISFHSGGIFALYSETEFRGKGYAEIVVRNMVDESRKRGRIPFGTIVPQNIPSQRLFEKIGFKVLVKADFIFP